MDFENKFQELEINYLDAGLFSNYGAQYNILYKNPTAN